jgi:peptide chain release factor 1
MIAPDRLRQILDRFAYLEARLGAAPAPGELAELTRDYAELRPVAERARAYAELGAEIEGARALLDDPEMRALAEVELAELEARAEAQAQQLRLALLPRDAADAGAAVLEIRPGTGGEEAALFAADLWEMYRRHAEARGWAFEPVERQETDLGGLKEGIARIDGEGVFARLKFESGVHRVQRVPATESGGRIHTSAATVAILPQAEEVAIEIAPEDLRIDTMRASGAGGQHVNTTDSAVRITHLPSGIVVTSSEKSQHRNREIAMQVLRARLNDRARSQAAAQRSADRRAQVGGGDRSERIRTYNFPQSRVTDHRIGLTLHRLDAILGGALDELSDALLADHQARLLAEAEG